MIRRAKAILVSSLLSLGATVTVLDVCQAQENKFKEAQEAFEKGNHQKALEIYDEIVNEYRGKNNKAVAEAYKKRSEVFRQLGDKYRGNVEQSLRDAIKADPQNPEFPLQLAQFYDELRRTPEAGAQYQVVLQLNPADTAALRKVVDFCMKGGAYPRAAEIYGNFLQKKSANPFAHYCWGLLLQKAKAISAAEKAFRDAVYWDSKYSEAHIALGRLYEEQDDRRNTEEEYKAVLRYDQRNREAGEGLKRLETIEAVNKNLQRAAERINQADIPTLTKIHDTLDSLSFHHPENDSIKNIRQAARSRLSDLWFQKGENWALRPETLQRAIQAYESSLSYARGDQEREMRAQTALAVIKRVGEVERGAERALELSEQERALKERKLSKLREAKEGFIAVSIFDPRRRRAVNPRQRQADIETWYVLGLVAIDSSNWDEAKFYFSQVLKSDPNYLDTQIRFKEARVRPWYVRGLAAMDSLEYDKAKLFFLLSLQIFPITGKRNCFIVKPTVCSGTSKNLSFCGRGPKKRTPRKSGKSQGPH